MKHISSATPHCKESELFQFQSVRLIGKWISGYGVAGIPKDEEMLDTLRSLPNIIPGSFIGWIGNHHPDGSAVSIFGIFAPPGTPCPEGYVFKDISAELSSDIIAKGPYGVVDCGAALEKANEHGYESPYCGIECYGWWEGELYLDGESFSAYSVLMPVRKIGRTII